MTKQKAAAPTRKPRKDKGTTRVIRKNPPFPVSFQLVDEPIERDVSKSLRNDLKRAKRINPRATIKTVLLEWLADYLGLKKE